MATADSGWCSRAAAISAAAASCKAGAKDGVQCSGKVVVDSVGSELADMLPIRPRLGEVDAAVDTAHAVQRAVNDISGACKCLAWATSLRGSYNSLFYKLSGLNNTFFGKHLPS